MNSACALQEQEVSIRELRQQNAELMAKHTLFQSEVLTLTKQVMAVKLEPKLTNSYEWLGTSANVNLFSSNTIRNLDSRDSQSGPPSLIDRDSEHSSDNRNEPKRPRSKTRATDLHPPRFKVLISRISKFSGEKAADNFEVWLEDYIVATGDCGWKDKD